MIRFDYFFISPWDSFTLDTHSYPFPLITHQLSQEIRHYITLIDCIYQYANFKCIHYDLSNHYTISNSDLNLCLRNDHCQIETEYINTELLSELMVHLSDENKQVLDARIHEIIYSNYTYLYNNLYCYKDMDGVCFFRVELVIYNTATTPTSKKIQRKSHNVCASFLFNSFLESSIILRFGNSFFLLLALQSREQDIKDQTNMVLSTFF